MQVIENVFISCVHPFCSIISLLCFLTFHFTVAIFLIPITLIWSKRHFVERVRRIISQNCYVRNIKVVVYFQHIRKNSTKINNYLLKAEITYVLYGRNTIKISKSN